VVAAMRAGSELSVVPKEEGGSSALWFFFGERTSRKKALVFSKGGAAFVHERVRIRVFSGCPPR